MILHCPERVLRTLERLSDYAPQRQPFNEPLEVQSAVYSLIGPLVPNGQITLTWKFRNCNVDFL